MSLAFNLFAPFVFTPEEIHERKIGESTIGYRVELRDAPVVVLFSVRTPQRVRGKGEGRRAMLAFLAATDAARLPVELIASPLDRRTQLGKLVRFYMGLGFKLTGKRGNPAGDPVMLRLVGG